MPRVGLGVPGWVLWACYMSSMTSTIAPDAVLLERVASLRGKGLTPKQVARALGLRPADVTRLVRQAAARASTDGEEPALVGCWVSPGWSSGLAVPGRDEWPDVIRGDEVADGVEGMATVVVARRKRSHRVSVCGYLVDTHCLGVKDVLGPQVMSDDELPAFRRMFFGPFEHLGAPLEVPLELARHLVWGAADAARGWGFQPAADFAAAADHLGPWRETSAITFGRDGVPFYVQGPYDDADAVIRTLRSTVGDENFHFYVQAEPALI